jgi:hypothetical protein
MLRIIAIAIRNTTYQIVIVVVVIISIIIIATTRSHKQTTTNSQQFFFPFFCRIKKINKYIPVSPNKIYWSISNFYPVSPKASEVDPEQARREREKEEAELRAQYEKRYGKRRMPAGWND